MGKNCLFKKKGKRKNRKYLGIIYLLRNYIIIFLYYNKMENEEWKTISEFPNYEVSNMGNVRVKETKYIMKPFKN